AGRTKVGRMVSRTVMVCTPLAALPHASAAVQVRAMTRVPAQLLLTTSLKLTVTAPQPSCAVATPVLLVVVTAGHSSVKFAGKVKVGGVKSRTVIVWMPFVMFPQASMAVQVRAMTLVFAQLVVTASLKLTVTAPQPSCEVATPVALVVVTAGHSNTTFAGKISEGAVTSRTVIV